MVGERFEPVTASVSLPASHKVTTMTNKFRRLNARFPRRRAFITGASSGLGLELARALGRDGWTLGLFDRNVERLALVEADLAAAGFALVAYPGDVTHADECRHISRPACSNRFAERSRRAQATQLMQSSGYSAVEAARDVLTYAGDGRMYIVLPGSARFLWRLKRWAPGVFLRQVVRLRERMRAAQ